MEPALMYHAAIFDMDGLLIDSEPLWHKAEMKVFATVGLTLSEADCRQTTGVRIDEVVRIRHGEQAWHNKSIAQVAAEIMEEVQHLAITEGKALPGVHDVLEELARRDFSIALASSSPLAMIGKVLRHLGIADYFEVLCSAADEQHGKPHPAVYLKTARQLALPPQACLAFEDSIPGVIAACAASMSVVAIPDMHHYDRPEFGIAQLKLRSLADFMQSDFMQTLYPPAQNAVPAFLQD